MPKQETGKIETHRTIAAAAYTEREAAQIICRTFESQHNQKQSTEIMAMMHSEAIDHPRLSLAQLRATVGLRYEAKV